MYERGENSTRTKGTTKEPPKSNCNSRVGVRACRSSRIKKERKKDVLKDKEEQLMAPEYAENCNDKHGRGRKHTRGAIALFPRYLET